MLMVADPSVTLERKVRDRLRDDESHRRVAAVLTEVAVAAIHPARHLGLGRAGLRRDARGADRERDPGRHGDAGRPPRGPRRVAAATRRSNNSRTSSSPPNSASSSPGPPRPSCARQLTEAFRTTRFGPLVT